MVTLDYRDVRPIYQQIEEGIRQQITTGILRKGDKLPSVRELACRLTINPNTIQRAYRELEMQGWIASVAGKGSFVCGIPGGFGEKDPLLADFDTAVEALLKAGMTRAELIARLEQGGNDHA